MGISSLLLLEQMVALVRKQGYLPHNVDATVVAETPKIGPHIPAMRTALATVLGIAEDRVNVKGTTAKGLGALGAGEGIAAFAVATIAARAAAARARVNCNYSIRQVAESELSRIDESSHQHATRESTHADPDAGAVRAAGPGPGRDVSAVSAVYDLAISATPARPWPSRSSDAIWSTWGTAS
jgi:hypothetical protein